MIEATVPERCFVMPIGESGSGKSTFLRIGRMRQTGVLATRFSLVVGGAGVKWEDETE